MSLDRKKARAYIDQLQKDVEENPESLEKMELNLARRMLTLKAKADSSAKQVDTLRNQINQAEARIRSLSLQAQNYIGQSNGFAESLISMKFGVDVEDDFFESDKDSPDQNQSDKSAA